MFARFSRKKEKHVSVSGSSSGSRGSSTPSPGQRIETSRASAYNYNVSPPTPPYTDDDSQPRSPPSPYETAFKNTFSNTGTLRVLIVGAGIGGLSAAIACARQGFEVTVLERGSGLSAHGDCITLGSNAAKLLFRWGVGQDMLSKSCRGGWWLQHSHNGLRVAEEDLRSYEAVYGAPILQGHRAQYLGDLGTKARFLGVEIRPNIECMEYRDCATPGVVTRSGEVIEGDVILIADGVRSEGRRLLGSNLGKRSRGSNTPQGDYSIYRGLTGTAALRRDPRFACLLDGNQRYWYGVDSHVTMSPLDSGRQISFTYTRRDPLDRASSNPRKKRPIEEVLWYLEGWDPLLLDALRHFKTVLNWRIMEEPPAAQWTTDGGHISFLGDAIHYLLPTSNQGGSQAMEDAATLAIGLALSPTDVPLALRTYEEIRKPRVERAQQLGTLTRDAWHSFATTGDVGSLEFQGVEMYEHDAEKLAMATFGRTARRMDPSFAVGKARKEEVMRNLGLA